MDKPVIFPLQLQVVRASMQGSPAPFNAYPGTATFETTADELIAIYHLVEVRQSDATDTDDDE